MDLLPAELAVLLLAGALAAGCGGSGTGLSNGHPSAEALAVAVLDGLERRDAARLRALALSEPEFREHVWPELPAARPERNLPFSYVWGDLHQKSEAALATTLARHGGTAFTLLAVRFGGATTRYPSYEVRRDTVVRVRTPPGAELELRLFGASLHKDGAWKVFSYVVDD